MYTVAMFIFFCEIPIYASLEQHSISFKWTCLPGLAFYGSGLACLLSWLGMANEGWLGSMRSKIFLQMKFIIFKAAPPNRPPFYLGSLLYIISSLFSHFCLFQNAILHKMLQLGFWNFNTIFLRMQFYICCSNFFSSFSYLFELMFAP